MPGLAGYDLRDIDSMAASRGIDFRSVVARAAAGDTSALRVILLFPDPADSTVLDASLGYPALLWHLLGLWGDRTFADELDMVLPESRRLLIAALDRGAGVIYRPAFPRTWALGPHDSTLAVPAPPPPSDSAVDQHLYGPARLHRLPMAEAGSCRPLVYPPELLDQGITGRAVVELLLDSTGTAGTDGIVAVAASHRPFAAAAEQYLRSCRYRPGRRGRHPVATNFRVEVGFVPDSVVIRTSSTVFEQLPSATVQPFAEAAGIPYSQVLIRAGRGDAGALRSVLGLAESLDAGSPVAADYAQALETMLVRWGDRQFAAAAEILSPAGQVNAAALLDFQREDLQHYPLTSAAIPPASAPPPPPEAAPDAEDAIEAESADAPPRARVGTCRLPQLPGDMRAITLHASVTVELVIDSSGRVDRRAVRVINSPGVGFNEPARDAAASCRYHPARRNGSAVAVLMRRTVAFDYIRQMRTR